MSDPYCSEADPYNSPHVDDGCDFSALPGKRLARLRFLSQLRSTSRLSEVSIEGIAELGSSPCTATAPKWRDRKSRIAPPSSLQPEAIVMLCLVVPLCLLQPEELAHAAQLGEKH